MVDQNDKPDALEPTPRPNEGASTPDNQPLSQPPVIERVGEAVGQMASDALSGAAQRRNYELAVAAAKGDPQAQDEYTKQQVALMAGSLGSGPKAPAKGGKLIHYSQHAEPLTELDPAFMGKGVAGKEQLRGDIIPRTYFYEEGTIPETKVTDAARYKYTVESPGKIVDWASPEGLELRSQATDINHLEQLAKDAGYAGYKNSEGPLPGAVAIFQKTKPVSSIPTKAEALERPHFLFTTENPLHATEGTPAVTREQAIEALRKQGLNAEPVKGRYGGADENSIIVKDVTPQQAEALHEFAASVGQESGLYSTGGKHELRYYHGPDAGKSVLGEGTTYHPGSVDDNYSQLANGQAFTHNLDFSKKVGGPSEAERVAETLRPLDEAAASNVPMPDKGEGLVQTAQRKMGVSQEMPKFAEAEAKSKALVGDAQAAYQQGQISRQEYIATIQKWQAAANKAARHSVQLEKKGKMAEGGMVQAFADGGEAMDLPTEEQTSQAFDQAFSQPFPTTPEALVGGSSAEPTASAPETPIAGGPVNLLNPEGKLISLDSEQVPEALDAGYSLPSPEHIADHIKQTEFGGLGQQVLTGLEGAAAGATFGLSTGFETALGVSPEDITARREVNPGTYMAGQLAGLGASLLTGVGEGALLTKAGVAGAEALGLGAATTVTAKLGSAAVKGAIENALFTAGDEVSKMLAKDPAQSVESAIADVGFSGLIGAGFGAVLGSVNPLWEAAMANKTSGLLGQIASHMGGIEGQVATADNALDHALQVTGLGDTLAPEVKAIVGAKPEIKELASILEQSDTSAAGKEFQAAMADARKQVASVQAEALGYKLDDIPAKGELDKYTVGKSVGETLAKEFDQRIAPLAKEYEEYATKFAGKELDPSIADKLEKGEKLVDKAFGDLRRAQKELSKALKANDPGMAIEAEAAVRDAQEALKLTQKAASAPGTTDVLVDRLSALAQREGWNASPSSDIMREVARVQKELPGLKTLKDLTNYIKQIGENTKSTLPFGQQTPVSRAGALMKNVLRDAESDMIEHHLGAVGEDAVARYRQTQQAFRSAATLKEAVDDRLGAGGSVSGYAKSVRAMSKQEGEKVLQRLLGTGDADWLATVQREFPETAKQLKEFHIDRLLSAAKDGDSLSSKKLLKAMDSMSPQLRQFSLSPEAQGQIKAAAAILEQLNDKTHNFSNTARTMTKLMKGAGGGALGAVAAMTGHNPIGGYLLGKIGEYVAKDVPDAVRLATLKFMGTPAPVNAKGFKAMADVINRVYKGDALVTKAAKNVFKDGDVLPTSKLPTEATRERLSKKIEKLGVDPEAMLKVGGATGHYMPEAAAAMGETSARVVNYVNSQRPLPKRLGPLDPPVPPTIIEQDHFNRVLDIAQQPLVVLEHVKNGTIQPTDVVALRAMYPKMYENLVNKLTAAMTDHMAAEEPVAYQTRIGLSMFLAQPLDSTMTPAAIMAAQPKPKEAPAQPGQATQPKRNTAKLGKSNTNYQTASQAREARSQRK